MKSYRVQVYLKERGHPTRYSLSGGRGHKVRVALSRVPQLDFELKKGQKLILEVEIAPEKKEKEGK